MKPPPKTHIVGFDSWLNDFWKLVELQSCKIKTGTYTGDGSTGQSITGVGFQPKAVWIWPHLVAEGGSNQYIKIDQTWGDYVFRHVPGAGGIEHYVYDNQFNSLDSDGFTVDDDGADSHPNTDSQVYDYLALG